MAWQLPGPLALARSVSLGCARETRANWPENPNQTKPNQNGAKSKTPRPAQSRFTNVSDSISGGGAFPFHKVKVVEGSAAKLKPSGLPQIGRFGRFDN
jgi:hypothetical protein